MTKHCDRRKRKLFVILIFLAIELENHFILCENIEPKFKLNITCTPNSIFIDPVPKVNVGRINVTANNEYTVESINYKDSPTSKSLYSKENNITNLEACTDYEIMAAISEVETNNYVTVATATVKTAYAEPLTTIVNSTSYMDGIRLTWTSANSNCVKYYRIQIESNNTITNFTKIPNTQFSYEIPRLEPCTTFHINLLTRDLNNKIISNQSTSSKSGYVDPGSVRNLRTHSIGSHSVEIEWDVPKLASACVENYTIKYADCYKAEVCDWEFKNAATKDTLTGLKPCTDYGVYVYTNNRESEDAFTNFITTLTNPDPVINLKAISSAPKEASISWDHPANCANCVTEYEISDGGPWIKLNKNQNFYIYYDRESCTENSFAVVAVYNDNIKSAESRVNVTIFEDRISEVSNLTLVEGSDGDISATWEKPLNAPYCVKEYRVVVWYLDPILNQPIEMYNEVKDKPFASIKGVFACVKYSVQIVPISITNKDGNNEIKSAVSMKRVILKHHISSPKALSLTKNTVILNTNLTKENKNYCKLFEAEFICRLDRDEAIMQSAGVEIDNKMTQFIATVDSLMPFSKYECAARIRNAAGWSEETISVGYKTAEDFPEKPRNVYVDPGTMSINITWVQPKVTNGVINNYRIYVIAIAPRYRIPAICDKFPGYNKTFSLVADIIDAVNNEMTDSRYAYNVINLLPYVDYIVQVAAINKAGIGEYSDPFNVTTLPTKSETVNFFNVLYIEPPKVEGEFSTFVDILWLLPCRSNGKLKNFTGTFRGTRGNMETHFFEWNKIVGDNYEDKFSYRESNLKPEYSYTVTINVVVEDVAAVSDVSVINFESPAGIPKIDVTVEWGVIDPFTSPNPTKNVEIVLSKSIFASDIGEIRYVALMVSERNCQEDPISKAGLLQNSGDWPNVTSWEEAYQEKCIPQYQTTPTKWNPIIGKHEDDEVSYIIGTDHCTQALTYCNGPLKPGTEYAVIVRLFSKSGFNDSVLITFKTDLRIAVYTIVLSVFGCLLIAFILGMLILWRTNKILAPPKQTSSPNDEPGDVSIKNFPALYEEIIQSKNNEKMIKEYKIINALTDDLVSISMTNNIAKANESKNRYTNILPYDINRVILDVEEYDREDDGLGDYINASYINGYKYQREYIATQGPKLETCFDFWKMILQCQVEIIVMLTQIVESNKIKCHQYFPDFDDEVFFNDISVKCSQELNFTIYKKRLFNVERNGVRRTVIQYHFNRWPDHECPKNPSDLIKFVKIVRQERKMPAAPMVVHCSAGVGRSGTLIALDILIQRIRQEKKINIYDTVKQLRMQRVKMVQTDKQYMFLYHCCIELTKGKNKKGVQKDNESVNNSVKTGKRITIKFPKNFKSGISDVKRFTPNDIESAM